MYVLENHFCGVSSFMVPVSLLQAFSQVLQSVIVWPCVSTATSCNFSVKDSISPSPLKVDGFENWTELGSSLTLVPVGPWIQLLHRPGWCRPTCAPRHVCLLTILSSEWSVFLLVCPPSSEVPLRLCTRCYYKISLLPPMLQKYNYVYILWSQLSKCLESKTWSSDVCS